MGSNMPELLTLVFPMSIFAPKSTELREGGLANASVLTCQTILFRLHFYLLLRLPVVLLQAPLVFHRWI